MGNRSMGKFLATIHSFINYHDTKLADNNNIRQMQSAFQIRKQSPFSGIPCILQCLRTIWSVFEQFRFCSHTFCFVQACLCTAPFSRSYYF